MRPGTVADQQADAGDHVQSARRTKLRSSDLRGKSLLVTFWSVDCEICPRDMPRLSRLHDSLKAQNFMVIGVAMPHDPPPAIIATVERQNPGYPIALDVHGEVNKAFGGIS